LLGLGVGTRSVAHRRRSYKKVVSIRPHGTVHISAAELGKSVKAAALKDLPHADLIKIDIEGGGSSGSAQA
jgi:hypothetical protein